MIGQHDRWIRYNKRLKIYSVCAAVVAAAIAILQKFNLEDWPDLPILSYWIIVAKDNTKFIVPICGAIIVLAQLSEKVYGPPQLWAVIHHLLTDLHEEFFPPECNKAENRVTLFQAKRFHLTFPWRAWPPWGCWLVPVERSHHMTRKSKVCWRVNDDGRVEGVAGQTYSQAACIHLENLPNITADSGGQFNNTGLKGWFYRHFFKRRFLNERQLVAIKLYSEKTWANEGRLIRHKVARKSLPRSLCGLPVDVGGKIWGVIVIDSRNPKMVDKETITRCCDQKSAILSKLLKYI